MEKCACGISIKTLFMEKNKILQASLLDIIFDDRNKVYGAYELRNKYSYRLSKALVVTGGLALVVMLASFVSSKFETPKHYVPIAINVLEIMKVEEEKPIELPPPVKPPVEQQRIETAQFVNPRVVDDHLVKPEDEMKDMAVLQDIKIGKTDTDGDKDLGITDPPIDEPTSGVIIGPKEDAKDKIAMIVDIQAKFPGGDEGWRKYISREIERYLDELQEDGKAGSCTVMFIVDTEGKISAVEALTMKGTKLAEICVNAVRKGPKWIPAELNGKKVIAYRKQPVTFKIDSE